MESSRVYCTSICDKHCEKHIDEQSDKIKNMYIPMGDLAHYCGKEKEKNKEE